MTLKYLNLRFDRENANILPCIRYVVTLPSRMCTTKPRFVPVVRAFVIDCVENANQHIYIVNAMYES